jgi:hypothetical protein
MRASLQRQRLVVRGGFNEARPIANATVAALEPPRVAAAFRQCAARVEEEADAATVAQLAQGFDVRNAHRLSTRHVHGAGKTDVGDSVRSLAPDQRVQFPEIDVALERAQVRRITRLVPRR